MHNILTKICSTVLVLALAPAVFGQVNKTTTTTTTTSVKKSEQPFFFKSGMALDDKDNMPDGKLKYTAAYTAPAGSFVDNGWDVNASVAYTYWYAGQDAMDVAYVALDTATATSGFVANQEFGYKSGFKIGLGLDTKCDDWSVGADYTWYTNKQASSFAGAEFAASSWFPEDTVPATLNTAVTSNWQLKMNMLDFVAGRPFYQAKRVVVAPSAGLRVLWLHQNMDIAMTGGTATRTYGGQSRSWALGPKAAVNTSWMLPGGFRIDGAMGSSVLYTRYTTIAMSQTVGADTAAAAEANRGTVRPSMDAGLGLGFGSYAMNNKLFFDVSARYDFMQFWSQNVLRNYSSQLNGYDDVIGDLRMHGLTLNVRCDF